MPSDHLPVLRTLTSKDAAGALELSTEAGWNQTEADWRLLIELAPEGSLAIEVAGEIASTATLIAYGQRLAWIGMVLTRTSFRGRGLAKRLLQECLSLADKHGIESVKLDATEQGKPLYEKVGFRNEQPVERWACERLVELSNTSVPQKHFFPSLLSADSVTFGADRSSLLRKLETSNLPAVLKNSFAMTRRGRISQYLGPCIAESDADAPEVIGSCLVQLAGQSCYWDLLPSNQHAVALAREHGFAPVRHLTRMVRGKDLQSNDRHIYALAGFELG